MINANEIQTANDCISFALENGADAVRVYLSKSGIDSCNILNGELDKVTHSADRSIYFYLYVDGKYGTYSTNRLVIDELKEFILNGIAMTRMLGEDPCRKLPEPCRTAQDAKTGREMGLYDDSIAVCDSESRLQKAFQMSIFGKEQPEGCSIISEECEYSESYDDSYTVDSQGFEGRHSESTFSCFTEITVQAESGDKYSGFWWDSACRNNVLQLEECSRMALKKAASQPMAEDEACMMVLHPGFVDEYVLTTSYITTQRALEVAMAINPEVPKWCEENGVQLITYKDL